jgi:hypothetical protein
MNGRQTPIFGWKEPNIAAPSAQRCGARCRCPTGCDAIGSRPMPKTSTRARFTFIVTYKKSRASLAQLASDADLFSEARCTVVASATEVHSLTCTRTRRRCVLEQWPCHATIPREPCAAILPTAAAGQHRTQCGGRTDVQALPATRRPEGSARSARNFVRQSSRARILLTYIARRHRQAWTFVVGHCVGGGTWGAVH